VLHARMLLELGDPPNSNEGEQSEEADCYVFTRDEDEPDFGYGIIIKWTFAHYGAQLLESVLCTIFVFFCVF
jgi:hypothetical protein